jgi:hypothetical protein
MTETSDFPGLMGRMLRAWVKRVAAADPYDLREMADVLGRNASPVWDAVVLNRDTEPSPWSWGDIGDALGITRQAAHQQAQRAREAAKQQQTVQGSSS